MFPPGSTGLLHLQVTDSLHQVWPTNPDGNFETDDETISYEDQFEIDQPPYELYAYTWNEDDTYDHAVYIRIGIRAVAGAPAPQPEEKVVIPEEFI